MYVRKLILVDMAIHSICQLIYGNLLLHDFRAGVARRTLFWLFFNRHL